MKKYLKHLLVQFLGEGSVLLAVEIVPANHPYIQYFGRWDFTDPLAPAHSWPGVYIYAEFEGTSIGVRLLDNFTYYNVFIDGELKKVLKGDVDSAAVYPLVSGLAEGKHSILFTKRSETYDKKYSFHGFVLDPGKKLLPPPEKPIRKIEFIGDSFTSAWGNEYTKEDKPGDDGPWSNSYEGFGAIVARHYQAQLHLSSRAGFGLIHNWQGDVKENIPDHFDRTLLCSELPKWDFNQWIPNLVVIGLGLNDYSGFGGWNKAVSEAQKNLFKTRCHEFISKLRLVYPDVKILAVAPHVEWLQKTISEIAQEENASGNQDVFYTFYPFFEGGYVFDGHPCVVTHHKIAEKLIEAIDGMKVWPKK